MPPADSTTPSAPLDVENSTGNGFRFDHYELASLPLGDRPGDGFPRPAGGNPRARNPPHHGAKAPGEFSHKEVARRYIEIYEKMLERPLVEKQSGEAIQAIAANQAASENPPASNPGNAQCQSREPQVNP